MILTSEQLTVIRAALQFWSEEMSPHGLDGCSGYLDDSVAVSDVDVSTVTSLRRRLQRCGLLYASISPGNGWRIKERPVNDRAMAEDSLNRFVTILD